jgi:hypothetical protein
LGLTLAEIIGRRIVDGSAAVSAGQPLGLEDRLRLIRSPSGARFETSLASGRLVEIIYRPLEDGGKLAIFRDITALRRREQEQSAGSRRGV